jgi:hypothetical protein
MADAGVPAEAMANTVAPAKASRIFLIITLLRSSIGTAVSSQPEMNVN